MGAKQNKALGIKTCSLDACRTDSCAVPVQNSNCKSGCETDAIPRPLAHGVDSDEMYERRKDEILAQKAVQRKYRAVLPISIWKSPSVPHEVVGELYPKEEVRVRSVVSCADGNVYLELSDGRGWLDASEDTLVNITLDQTEERSLHALDRLATQQQLKAAEKALEFTLEHVLHPVDGGEAMTLRDVLANANPGHDHHHCHKFAPNYDEVSLTDEDRHHVLGLHKKQVVQRFFELHHEFHVSHPHGSPDKAHHKGARVPLDKILMNVNPTALLAVRDDHVNWHSVYHSLDDRQKQEEVLRNTYEDYDEVVNLATHHTTADEWKSWQDVEQVIERRQQEKANRSCHQCDNCGSRKVDKGRSCEGPSRFCL
eukprot:gnl/MRDRNA2_/MRDRNA2_150012_c0_seq1.p1 gnl/MRDRNA2_/MRDRNA2_150012_c0~~gnl/MRDRNA2_/MRDRNA2_150012_c0_seq1.p1  ORF type:complete len:369 (+),score=59.10 gnl/MRDRNA2_/MRDRNA2_150012_c0_seq1:273-1379(+)